MNTYERIYNLLIEGKLGPDAPRQPKKKLARSKETIEARKRIDRAEGRKLAWDWVRRNKPKGATP